MWKRVIICLCFWYIYRGAILLDRALNDQLMAWIFDLLRKHFNEPSHYEESMFAQIHVITMMTTVQACAKEMSPV